MADDDKTDNTAAELATLKKDMASLKKALTDERSGRAEAEKQLGILRTKTAGDKSEMEKLQDQLGDLLKSQKDSELRALRLEVAAEKGLSAKQARRLSGATRSELESDADDLIEEFGIKKSSKTEDGTSGDSGKSGDAGKTDDKTTSEKDGKPESSKSLLKPREKLVSGNGKEPDDGDVTDLAKAADNILSGI
jgi:hypothetical protein